MSHKKIYVLITATLLATALAIVFTNVAVITWREVIVGIVVYLVTGLLILGYLSRFALIFIGVFALYRLLYERHQRQLIAKNSLISQLLIVHPYPNLEV
jgi:hypothetical protein